jgi:preprotein translocase subunit SecG
MCLSAYILTYAAFGETGAAGFFGADFFDLPPGVLKMMMIIFAGAFLVVVFALAFTTTFSLFIVGYYNSA